MFILSVTCNRIERVLWALWSDHTGETKTHPTTPKERAGHASGPCRRRLAAPLKTNRRRDEEGASRTVVAARAPLFRRVIARAAKLVPSVADRRPVPGSFRCVTSRARDLGRRRWVSFRGRRCGRRLGSSGPRRSLLAPVSAGLRCWTAAVFSPAEAFVQMAVHVPETGPIHAAASFKRSRPGTALLRSPGRPAASLEPVKAALPPYVHAGKDYFRRSLRSTPTSP